MKSVMKHLFSQIPRAQISRSVFDRSHGWKSTFDSGYLVPFLVDEVLPGDSYKVKFNFLARLSTPIVPTMDNLFVDTFYFFVPYRLLWKHWEQFNGQQDYPGASTDYLVPQTTAPADKGFPVGSLEDYFGLPTGVKGIKANELAARAYALIWNEWFRDENLQNPINLSSFAEIKSASGLDDVGVGDSGFIGAHKLLRRGKRHDYFTSALPWPQKGPGVELPLSGNANVYGNGKALKVTTGSATGYFGPNSNDTHRFHPLNGNGTLGSGNGSESELLKGSIGVVTSGNSGLIADLSSVTAATINSLRQAFQIQKLYERDARGGTRYTEILRSHFGVVSPDSRLQRPEYLGGSESPVIISPVVQNSATGSTGAETPQGNLAAYGLASSTSAKHGFTKSFVEHGIIIGLLNVRADLTYQQGIPRMFSRRTRFDFYWPVLAHLGEQAILNKEIYAQGTPADDDVFGYQERYAEYRYFPSMITGKLRSTDPQSLDVWHLSQKFNNLPTLSAQFIEDNPPVSRILAVQNEPQFIIDSYLEMKCARPMPVYGVPGLVDHF
uniref:Major capsid protein n=1 Tax=Microviridae sp. ctydc4 TaxID=2827623 RepID=A0A8S5LQ71_9VIRU|nr:MAG TPA: major capsid protein [Microviridae sp. ctydc4]